MRIFYTKTIGAKNIWRADLRSTGFNTISIIGYYLMLQGERKRWMIEKVGINACVSAGDSSEVSLFFELSRLPSRR